MSFLLDPPSLFILGAAVYIISRKFHIPRLWVTRLGVVIVSLFIVMSVLLYLDVLRWQIPFIMDMEGSVWMFHSDITGIYKADVPVALIIFLFCLYPLWYYLGYISAQYLSRKIQLENKVYNLSQVKSRGRPKTEAYSIKRGAEPRKLLRECLSDLGGISEFVKEGDRVLIKVNICGGNPKRHGSFTSIEIADELSQLIKDAKATPVVVDADMIWTEFWPVAYAEGYAKWAKRSKVKLLNLSETKLAYFDFGGALKKIIISKELLEADVIISVPTMKTHLLTGVTMGMKNMYGTFPQMDKAVYHKIGIEEVIFEINRAFTPNLTIIDGSIGGEAMGPLSSDPVNFKTIIASGNVVVADSIACLLMGYEPLGIEHIRFANEAGLGNAEVTPDLTQLEPHEKDGKWERPSLEAARLYNEIIETVLKYPTTDVFFNLLADFVFYDMATLPIFENLTPEMLTVINDIADDLKLSGRIRKGWLPF